MRWEEKAWWQAKCPSGPSKDPRPIICLRTWDKDKSKDTREFKNSEWKEMHQKKYEKKCCKKNKMRNYLLLIPQMGTL